MGLGAITLASVFVDPLGALAVGIVGGAACYWGATKLKQALGYDVSLDAFGVHGIGGIVGALLTGVFAVEAIGGTPGVLEGNITQLWTQFVGILATIIYSAVVTFIILKIIKALLGLRVDDESEVEGLDLNLHGENIQ